MKKRNRANALLWLLISILAILVLVLLIVKQRQYQKHDIVPEVEQMDIAEPPQEPAEGTAPEAVIPLPVKRPRVAVVIDDMGYDRKIFNRFVDLNVPITFAVLPGERFSKSIAKEASSLNYEVILHLPMEPHSPMNNPGNGTLLTGMTHDELIWQLSSNIEEVPHIAGVNNHMGSLLTENRDVMDIVLREIKKKGLFFLDSMTSPKSVAYETARSIGMRSVKRDVFLDNKADQEYIKGQFDKAIRIAKKKGEATAIGHPRKETVAALKAKLSDFEKEGIELVHLSQLIDSY